MVWDYQIGKSPFIKISVLRKVESLHLIVVLSVDSVYCTVNKVLMKSSSSRTQSTMVYTSMWTKSASYAYSKSAKILMLHFEHNLMFRKLGQTLRSAKTSATSICVLWMETQPQCQEGLVYIHSPSLSNEELSIRPQFAASNQRQSPCPQPASSNQEQSFVAQHQWCFEAVRSKSSVLFWCLNDPLLLFIICKVSFLLSIYPSSLPLSLSVCWPLTCSTVSP